MDKRTMVKTEAGEQGIYVSTYSREYRSPRKLYIPDAKFGELKEKGHVLLCDIHTFAKISLLKTAGGESVLRLVLYWISCDTRGNLSGREEEVELGWEAFERSVKESRRLGGACERLLSVKERRKPSIEFANCRNLKQVAGEKTLRKKLGKFLSRNFDWYRTQKILITDDFEPYSFFFRELRESGAGICGGIILHSREDLTKAYYGLHT